VYPEPATPSSRFHPHQNASSQSISQLALAQRLRTWASGRSRFDDRGNAVRTVGLLAMDDFGVRPVTAPRGRSAVNWSTTGCIQMHDDLFAAA